MQKMRLCGFVTGLALCSSTFIQAAAFTDAANGFSITPPPGWTQVQPTPSAALVAFKAPTSADGINSNINVIKQELPSAMSVQDYAKAATAQMVKGINAKVVATKNDTMGGYPAVSEAFTATVQGKPLAFIQSMTVVGKRVYVITLTTTQSQAQKMSALFPDLMKSFKINK